MAMQRRELLIGAGAAIATATAGRALASEHAGHGNHAAKKTSPTPRTIVFDNAIALRALGEMCIAFCLDNIPEDPSLVDCARTAKEMLAVNGAIEQLAAMDSPRLMEVAKATVSVYDNCQKICEKHEAHHKICRQCAKQCAEMKIAIAALT
ncbi:MAG: hypothetical protein P8K76_10500 [Candidatus Binatia bacterium]|nr:hypothetical protein [Candidatus Binatia bacterium]MDG1959738.1 hypothetical protein [Candidatus Binatia bacterium]MDG2010201.1 hypothetical protein [Candidatus Binatia bacterium]